MDPFENWDLTKPIDYIPVKKRKTKKKPPSAPTYNMPKPTEENQKFFLGQLQVGTTSNLPPDAWDKCVASFFNFEERDEESLLLALDLTSVIVNLLLESSLVKAILTTKVFSFDVVVRSGDVMFDLYFTSLPLPKFYKKIGTCLQSVFEIFYNISLDESSDTKLPTTTITQLYQNIKSIRKQELKLGCANVQHSKLKPQLRPYQADAVRWMLHREKTKFHTENLIQPLYTPIKLKSGLEIYFDKYSGFVDLQKPLVEESSCGGILADEMGLGKTVEVLACILNHPKSFHQTHNVMGEASPTVKIIPRKRKLQEREESALVDAPKKIKVPEDWAKKPKREKSQLRVALEMWYETSLQGYKIKSAKPPAPERTVQCLCGSASEKGAFSCVDCGKLQHGPCVGYRKEFGAYRCPQCWSNQPLLECGATLIVSPVSLRKQWCKEICRHIEGEFRVLVYGGSSVTPVYPADLQNFDVVITTYSVLQNEFRLTDEEKTFSLRFKRKYSPPKSSLTRVKWWRLCLDEAQTVEAPTSMVSEMAKKLTAEFRWAVTGTPISKEISDLHGLIDYLQIQPYNDKFTWINVLFDPYLRGNLDPMNKFLAQVMWRSSKAEVINQIDIPKQTIKEHWIDFSAVEHYFYRREHQLNCEAFLDKIKSYDPNLALESLHKSSLKTILAPLLSLRKVCTYPNSIKTRYLATKKPVQSMKDLLKALISRNTNESEEFLRIIVSALNGLAGIYLLLQQPERAVEEYRSVLQLYVRFTEEEKIAKLSVDKLQVIHTMHNLAEILGICPNVGKTLRDNNLLKDCDDLEHKYLGKFITQSMSALQDSSLISASVHKLQNGFVLEPGKWYSDLLNWIYINDFIEDLYTKIETLHSIASVACTIDYRSGRLLPYAIAKWDSSISDLREDSIEVVNNLYTHCANDEFQIVISKELVAKATNCHLTPSKKAKSTKKKCPICIASDHLKSYELKLFSMTKRTQNYEEMSLKGTWKPTSEELCFKAILSVGKLKNANADLVKDGETHMTIVEILKKEFKEIRRFWTHLHQQVSAQDELSMCKIRLRLRDEGEDGEKQQKKLTPMVKNLLNNSDTKLETIHVLSSHELEYQRSLLHSEHHRNLALLEKNLGVRSYLETLREQQYEGQNLDPCPICKNTLQEQWSIIPCGHSYCLECIQPLIEQTKGHHVQCCVCRAQHLVAEISYIKTGEQKPIDERKIKGDYSTKVESIIKLILDLRSQDESVKVLVFSSWVSVLNYVKTALTNNDISNELIVCGNLEKQIEKFKDPNENVTTLLLPIRLGSKGLNLIEATHVVLIEPLLNRDDELQAIGRVHRIGQTKPTVVHKFFVKDTIEESIQKAVSMDANNWEKNKITIKQLMGLFIANASEIEDAAPPQEENVIQ